MPEHWIYDFADDQVGYSMSYKYRVNISHSIKGFDSSDKPLLTWDSADKRWGESLRIVACQKLRRRFLYGKNNPPILEEVTPPRYIILELIAKSRNNGFLQSDFQGLYKMDSRTSFHHIKVLIKLHLITKQNYLTRINRNLVNQDPIPPKTTKILHLSSFANYTSNQLNSVQKYAARICDLLDGEPIERGELKAMCKDIPQYKRIRQWLYNNGYIQYIVGEEQYSIHSTPIQAFHSHSKKFHVGLLRKYTVSPDLQDDNDEFLDYIENCDDIEPQLVYEESLHHQGYRVILACRENGITMKKFAEVLCIPYAMARSIIRYFDTNKLGRVVTVDHLKLKYQKIVAIQFLHKSETVQKLQSNKKRIEEHKAKNLDIKPNIEKLKNSSSQASLNEQNLALAEDLEFKRVSEKSSVSLRKLARINHILDSLKETPVFNGTIDLYKSLLYVEESQKSFKGTCCRKTFRKIINNLVEEGQVKSFTIVLDASVKPPITKTFYCSVNITESSEEYIKAVNIAKLNHEKLEKRQISESNKQRSPAITSKTSKDDNKSISTSKIKLSFEKEETLTDTENEEEDKETVDASSQHNGPVTYAIYGRFQRLYMFHLYLWKLVYGANTELEEFAAASQCPDTFIDLVQSKHIWLREVDGLPDYCEGEGWFNVGDIIFLMPLELTNRVLGIKTNSETAKKYLKDNKKKLLRMKDLPPHLKYRLLVGPSNRRNLDVCVELLVLLAQMGLVALSPVNYPSIRSEIMLYLRRSAKIVDTRFSESSYCQTILPKGLDKFPENTYRFDTILDVEKYWSDLKFICLNTPLGVSKIPRSKKTVLSPNSKSQSVGETSTTSGFNENGCASKPGSSSSNTIESNPQHSQADTDNAIQQEDDSSLDLSKVKIGRVYRSFTVLRDFQTYFGKILPKDFPTLEPALYGNGLGAGGLDSTFFSHLAKNWTYGKNKKNKDNRIKDFANTTGKEREISAKMKFPATGEKTSVKKTKVKNYLVKRNTGGKGLKRKFSQHGECSKSFKERRMERQKNLDKLLAKRAESVREKIRILSKKRMAMRKSKGVLQAQSHDDQDRRALRLKKGERVSFTDREDAYVLLIDIVRSIMKLSEKGGPLEKEHPKVLWQELRNVIHEDIPESHDKTWHAIHRRSRNMKKYNQCLIIYKTCAAELEQNKEFMNSIKCTKDNWKEKLRETFVYVKEVYTKHLNLNCENNTFPSSFQQFKQEYQLEYIYREEEDESLSFNVKSEEDIRRILLRDLIQNALTAQKLPSYVPSVAFKIFDAYPRKDLEVAHKFYQSHNLTSRVTVEIPRRRSIPIQTKMFNLSNVYYRFFEMDIPLRIFLTARSFYMQTRDGKIHMNVWKENELNDLPATHTKDSISVDFKQIQGGHVAYIFSALLNQKVKLSFQLPDEVTTSDEKFMLRLQEGQSKFQKIAFEQRLRKVETLQKKAIGGSNQFAQLAEKLGKSVVTNKDGDQESTCKTNQRLKRKRDITQGENSKVKNKKQKLDHSSILSEQPIRTLDERVSFEASKNSDDTIHSEKDETHDEKHHSEVCKDDEDTTAKKKDNKETTAQQKDNKETIANQKDDKETTANQKDDKETTAKQKDNNETTAKKKDNKETTAKQKDNKETTVNQRDDKETTAKQKDDKETSDRHKDNEETTTNQKKTPIKSIIKRSLKKEKKSVSFVSHSNEKIPRILKCLSFNSFSMECFFRAHNGDIRAHNGDTKVNQNKKTFTLSDKFALCRSRVNTNKNISNVKNIAGTGKLAYSKTSLAMQRTLASDSLVPKNAMNSHDTLIVHPVSLDLHLYHSPFSEVFLDTNKVNNGGVIEHFRKQKATSSVSKSSPCLSVDEYKDILKNDMMFNDVIIDDHITILRLVGFTGVYGFPINKFTEILCDKLSDDLIKDWRFHVQTLLNFRMLFKVGIKEDILVTFQNLNTWTYKAPQQIFSENANKDGKKDSSTLTTNETTQSRHHDEDVSFIEVEESAIANNKSIIGSKESEEPSSHSEEKESREGGTPTRSEENKSTNKISKESSESLEDNEKNVGFKFEYKTVGVKPWLKLSGNLNGQLLRRYQEVVLVYIMSNPGTLQEDVFKNFAQILNPVSTKNILEFLEINGAITKHYQPIRKASLFGNSSPKIHTKINRNSTRTMVGYFDHGAIWSVLLSYVDDESMFKVYYMPTKCGLLNMMDINR